MVTVNPFFQSPFFSRQKLRATVTNDIWPAVLFFTLIATMVVVVSETTSTTLAINNQMLTVLGTVLGLVISFRTSTAYERFSEARKLWTTISIASRTLAQIIWIHVPFDRIDKATGQKKPALEIMIEKKSMVNLIQAFSVSVKHLLRGEGGAYYADLYPLISCLPRFSSPHNISAEEMLPLWKASNMDHRAHQALNTALRSVTMSTANLTLRRTMSEPAIRKLCADDDEKRGKGEINDRKWFDYLRSRSKVKTFDPERALPILPSEQPLKPARNPPITSPYNYLPFLPLLKPIVRRFRSTKGTDEDSITRHRTFTGQRMRPKATDSNVPLEVTLSLSSYYTFCLRNGLLQPASAISMLNAILSLQDTFSNLERIMNTPLPFAYQAHLRITLWLYLFLIPFQIFANFKYLTIPATAFASFLLLGFLEIGQEIENPFNYDPNDLDLDQFCLIIQRELHEITAYTTPELGTFIFTKWNQPFAPADRRSAKEMMKDINHEYHGPETGIQSIRKTLLKSWSTVDEMTRRCY